MKSIISARGQITVPAAVQRALDMHPGAVVEFELLPDAVLLRKRAPKSNPFDQAYGILKSDRSTDEILRQLRGPALVKTRLRRK